MREIDEKAMETALAFMLGDDSSDYYTSEREVVIELLYQALYGEEEDEGLPGSEAEV